MPLRERLMAMVQRPVNIQATRDFVMYVRGELLGQPYLMLIDKTADTERRELPAPVLQHPPRRRRPRGGAGRRDHAPASPISSSFRKRPTRAVVDRLAAAVRHGAVRRAAEDVARVHEPRARSRSHTWHRPRLSRHAFLEIHPAGADFAVFGVHLSAVHAAWTERRRVLELGTLLRDDSTRTSAASTCSPATSTRWRPATCSTSASCRRACARSSG